MVENLIFVIFYSWQVSMEQFVHIGTKKVTCVHVHRNTILKIYQMSLFTWQMMLFKKEVKNMVNINQQIKLVIVNFRDILTLLIRINIIIFRNKFWSNLRRLLLIWLRLVFSLWILWEGVIIFSYMDWISMLVVGLNRIWLNAMPILVLRWIVPYWRG